MQFYRFSVAVGGTFPVTARGSYVRYYSNSAGAAAPTVELRTDRGEVILLAPNESARANAPFSQLTVFNFDGINTISGIFQIGDGDIQQNTFSGSVAITAITQNGAHVNGKVAVTNGAGGVQLRAAAAAARYLLIQNPDTSGGNIFIRTDGAAPLADATAIKLKPGESYEPAVVPTGVIKAIADVASIDIQVTTS
jgi:hypothetical protein